MGQRWQDGLRNAELEQAAKAALNGPLPAREVVQMRNPDGSVEQLSPAMATVKLLDALVQEVKGLRAELAEWRAERVQGD